MEPIKNCTEHFDEKCRITKFECFLETPEAVSKCSKQEFQARKVSIQHKHKSTNRRMLTTWLPLDEAGGDFLLEFSSVFSAKAKDKASVSG